TTGEVSRSGKARAPTTLRLSLKILTALALLAGVPFCPASPSPGGTDGTEKQANANPTEIPFRLYSDNLIVVKGSMGGIREVNFILDTGTSPTIISETIATRLKLRGQPGLIVTLKGTTQAESLIVPHLQIGRLVADSVKVAVQDLRSAERILGISLGGIVGLDILSTTNFSIDYQRRKIVFGYVATIGNVIPLATRTPLLSV